MISIIQILLLLETEVENENSSEVEELKMYLLIRGDIEMPEGKLAIQAAHAILGAWVNCHDEELKAKYLGLNPEGQITSGQAKISLKAKNLHAMERARAECRALGISTALVTDAGRTVFNEPTVTCLGIGPVTRSKLPPFVEKMRMY